ncbi:flagellar motor protein MotD [Tepidiphilus margaritifer]|uniref:flagellar motor protein MotD n=1 Tax=Tepidiphilus margaritifer TaxID=203471 RepID=UPI0004916905|nr:flagellar motor protein MotD [Tepidiphilus margaritifer]
MARRGKKEEEHENLERWLVSYADFITLLFAFFVVMYALTSANEGKYRVISESLSQAFRAGLVTPQVQEGKDTVVPSVVQGLPLAVQRRAPPERKSEGEGGPREGEEQVRQVLQTTAQTASALRSALAPLIDAGRVSINDGAFGVTVEMDAGILFPSGEATLGPMAIAALRQMARVLAFTGDAPIWVEGHTDNVPLRPGARYASNWELSAARAAAVVQLFIQEGVAPSRLAAVGYADQRPIADNSTEEGRQKNRRVTIRLESRIPVSGANAAAPANQAVPASGAIGSILPPSP